MPDYKFPPRLIIWHMKENTGKKNNSYQSEIIPESHSFNNREGNKSLLPEAASPEVRTQGDSNEFLSHGKQKHKVMIFKKVFFFSLIVFIIFQMMWKIFMDWNLLMSNGIFIITVRNGCT